jgi:hypothetical protein
VEPHRIVLSLNLCDRAGSTGFASTSALRALN